MNTCLSCAYSFFEQVGPDDGFSVHCSKDLWMPGGPGFVIPACPLYVDCSLPVSQAVDVLPYESHCSHMKGIL